MYSAILFDLDGTLTDPAEGITNSVAYALRHFGIETRDNTTLYPFIGPPLTDSFSEFCGFGEAQVKEAIKKYREYFREKGIFENELYPGVPEMLDRLKGQGKKIVMATSKPEVFAETIARHFDIYRYFDFIGGSLLNETRTAKSEVVAYALEAVGITDIGSCVMVGDRKHDIIGAKNNSLTSVGVLYGYGSREELAAAGADRLAETVEELGDILCEP